MNLDSRTYFWAVNTHSLFLSLGFSRMLLVWPGGGLLVSDCANVTKLIGRLHHWDICLGTQEAKWLTGVTDVPFLISLSVSICPSVCSSVNVYASFRTLWQEAFCLISINLVLIVMKLSTSFFFDRIRLCFFPQSCGPCRQVATKPGLYPHPIRASSTQTG